MQLKFSAPKEPRDPVHMRIQFPFWQWKRTNVKCWKWHFVRLFFKNLDLNHSLKDNKTLCTIFDEGMVCIIWLINIIVEIDFKVCKNGLTQVEANFRYQFQNPVWYCLLTHKFIWKSKIKMFAIYSILIFFCTCSELICWIENLNVKVQKFCHIRCFLGGKNMEHFRNRQWLHLFLQRALFFFRTS